MIVKLCAGWTNRKRAGLFVKPITVERETDLRYDEYVPPVPKYPDKSFKRRAVGRRERASSLSSAAVSWDRWDARVVWVDRAAEKQTRTGGPQVGRSGVRRLNQR